MLRDAQAMGRAPWPDRAPAFHGIGQYMAVQPMSGSHRRSGIESMAGAADQPMPDLPVFGSSGWTDSPATLSSAARTCAEISMPQRCGHAEGVAACRRVTQGRT